MKNNNNLMVIIWLILFLTLAYVCHGCFAERISFDVDYVIKNITENEVKFDEREETEVTGEEIANVNKRAWQ